MTRDDMLKMAREVGLVSTCGKYDDWIDAGPSGEELMEFSKLVAAAKCKELSEKLKKMPLNDTANSIAIWIENEML